MPRRRSNRRSRRSSSRRRSSAARRAAVTHGRPSLKSALLRKLHAVAPGAPVTARTLKSATVKVSLGRAGGKGSEAYACASYGAAKKASSECATGRNPRVAMAGALRKLAGKLESRGGVFNGLSGGGKRRRRRRSRR
jgi:hypothetical protein